MRVLLAAALLLILLAVALPAGAESVLLVTSEYEPYVSVSGPKKGFLHEVVEAAFHEVGIEARIIYRPWRRCALMVEGGQAFGAFPYARTEGREMYAWFSDTIWECRNVFFFNKKRMKDFTYSGLDKLRPYRIAGTSGNYYEDIFREVGLNVDYAPGEASGVHKIHMGRTELFAEDDLVGWTLINRIFPEDRDEFDATVPWNVNPQHIMVSRQYPWAESLMARFNTGLAAIRKNGVYDRILSKYLCR